MKLYRNILDDLYFFNRSFFAQPSERYYKVTDLDDRYIIKVDVPGFSPANIKITFKNKALRVTAKHDSETSREINLSWEFHDVLDAKNIQASVKNGVITICVLKDKEDSNVIEVPLAIE